MGVGCALGILPSLPDLYVGLPPDGEEAKTRVIAVWNAMLALGSALGAQTGAAVYERFGLGLTCDVMVVVSAVLVANMLVGLQGSSATKSEARVEVPGEDPRPAKPLSIHPSTIQ